TPFTEHGSLYPVHTNHRIVTEGGVLIVPFGHRLIIRIAEIADPYQRIGIDLDVFLYNELGSGLAFVAFKRSRLQVKGFRMVFERVGIDLLAAEDAVIGL